MMQRLFARGAALAAMVLGGATLADAQVRYTGPLPVEVEWDITERGTETVGPTAVTVEMRYRNISGYTVGGFWGLGGISFGRPFVTGCDGPCTIMPEFLGIVGNVDTRDLGVGQPAPLLADLAEWNFWDGDTEGRGLTFGPAGTTGGWASSFNVGMLGCAIPINDPNVLFELPAYAGRTCLSEGFDGWLAYRFILTMPDAETRDAFAASDISVAPIAWYFDRATVVVPTPATAPLVAFGLVGLLWRARRRARASVA